MKSLRQIAKQNIVDEIIRTGHSIDIPQSLQPELIQSLSDRFDSKKKITKTDIQNTLKSIKYANDLKRYTKHFFDKNFYGFPLELMKGFTHFIEYAYENHIISKFLKSKKDFRVFEFHNDSNYYQYVSITYSLHFYIVLFKYSSKIYLLLYDTETHNLHFALPISEDY